MIWNQHCQHFAPSLVQGRVIILPSPEPRAPHSYHTQASMLGWGMLLQVSGDPPPPEDPWDRGLQDRGRLCPQGSELRQGTASAP